MGTDQDTGPGSGEEATASTSKGSLAILGLLLLVAAFVVWKQFFSAPKTEPAIGNVGPGGKVRADGKKAKKARKAGTGKGAADSLSGAGRAAAADSGKASQPVARWSIREEDAGEEPQDPESYAFARVPWEDPGSEALRERVRRLGEGFDRRPVGRFSAVEGREVFLRLSMPVIETKDRKLSRIPESAVAEYLPEWYQRGFTLHFRGHREPFSPRSFRLGKIPGSLPSSGDDKERLVKYAVYAEIATAADIAGGSDDADRGSPDALLIYPHAGRERGEGANGFTEAGELRSPPPDAPFDMAYFRRLTGGPIDSLRAYALADRGFLVVEAHARRSPQASSPARHGAFLFLVRPEERKIAFLVHGFDARPCRKGKDIRFRGILDVGGDETPELLLGPHPAFLVHEDAEGIKYHYAAGSACQD